MKYKIFGLILITAILVGLYFAITPREDDILPYTYKMQNIQHLEIKRMNDTKATKITDTALIKPIVLQLLNCKKDNALSSAKGGNNWIDLTVFFNDYSPHFFRVYENKLWGTYISGHNFDYRNDSLKIVLNEILNEH